MKRFTLSVIALAALALSACGGNNSHEYTSTQEIASAIGCTTYTPDDESMALEESYCTVPSGKEVGIVHFQDKETAAQWMDAAGEFGISWAYVGDKGWVVSSEDRPTRDAIAKTLDAKLGN